MKAYIAWVSEYVSRVLKRLDTAAGIALGIGLFLVLFVAGGVGATLSVQISVGITLVLLFEATYGVFREERQMRAERESSIKVTAKPSSWAINHPDPGPDKVSLSVHVIWEVWVKEDISTDKLALNLIYVYDKPWWKFWKKTRFPQMGIPPKDQGTRYRKRIGAKGTQPFGDGATFEYIGDREEEGDPHWLLELVLITGMPAGEHRIPVFIEDYEMRSRGTYPPL
ncbi:MAG: hypothetical protein IH864_04000 [Chloroflexi bacterium]|nr:hypothetical protein [Chloroflexota bacterium]